MLKLALKAQLTDKQLDERAGQFLNQTDYEFVIGNTSHTAPLEICDAETGAIVAVWVPNLLSAKFIKQAFFALREAASVTDNRGTAAGSGSYKRIRADGSVSTSTHGAKVMSSVVGYFDRYPRRDYCRACAWNYTNPEKWDAAVPMIQEISHLFSQYAKEKYLYQEEVASQVKPDWLIPGTVFSTVTVNKNFRTALHRDGLNLAHSFSAFNVLRTGNFLGGQLVFPRYRVAFQADNGDLLFFAPQEPHGNIEIKQLGNQKYERLSFVYYLREKMKNCGTMEEELQRGKERHGAM